MTEEAIRKEAYSALYEIKHDMKTKEGIINLLAATGLAVLHDVDGVSIQKANTLTYQSSVILRALQG